MKKTINILMVFMLVFLLLLSSLYVKPLQANANAVSGANALKGAVINIMESNGIKFTNDKAREKAYDAWNMKAYEKWKADEANGRNQELWDEFNGVFRDPQPNIQPVEKPGMPGYAEILLGSNVYGMALLIGAEIGYGIEEAQAQNRYYKYAMTDLNIAYGGLENYDALFNLSYSGRIDHPNYPTTDYLNTFSIMNGQYGINVNSSKKVDPDPRLGVRITSFSYGTDTLTLGYTTTQTNSSNGQILTRTGKLDIPLADANLYLDNLPIKPYEYIPKPDEVPIINPNPNIEPLIRPNVDPSKVPEIIPNVNPVPVIVPIEDPFIENPYINPYTPPEIDPGTDPGTKPGTPPEIPVKTPGTDTPPYERPESTPNTEIPEYPEETQSTETPSLFGKLWEWLKAILDALFKILNAILALPFVLLEALWEFLWDLIKAVFVPSEDFWDSNLNELKKVIYYDELEEMVDDFSNIADGGGGTFDDIVVSLMGVDGLTVIDSDSINSILDNIHSWVRGVIFPLLILFNINSLYKLIRGTSLVEATKGLAAREKGGK